MCDDHIYWKAIQRSGPEISLHDAEQPVGHLCQVVPNDVPGGLDDVSWDVTLGGGGLGTKGHEVDAVYRTREIVELMAAAMALELKLCPLENHGSGLDVGAPLEAAGGTGRVRELRGRLVADIVGPVGHDIDVVVDRSWVRGFIGDGEIRGAYGDR